MKGPSLSEGIVSCRDCEWIIWYHCGHPGAPQGEIAYDEEDSPLLANALPRGTPVPCPTWCPYQHRIAHLENMKAIEWFSYLSSRSL